MAKFHTPWFSCAFLVVFMVIMSVDCSVNDAERKVHIVYMGALPEGEYSPSSYHTSMLEEVVESSFISQSLIRSYTRSFNAFAANLTEQEGQKLASFEGVVSIFPSKTLQPQTTRSWDFMGFSENVYRNPTIESDVIVGLIDTGIWPEVESFRDEGFGPPPKKWKGECKGGRNFTCNNKIIGARYYNSEMPTDDTARDTIGHGTHTASTAAGNNVKNANFYELAQGTARGGVPSARIAAYKACHPDAGCQETDMLAAFDDAIADGVDIISISIGGQYAVDLINDSIAIGAFHAMERGILTINSAGNSGFSKSTVSSVAPWILTVAASTTDRRIVDKVVLGNGRTLVGNAVNSFELKGSKFPLVYETDVMSACDKFSARLHSEGCLESDSMKGKIVLCFRPTRIEQAHKAGALGSIAPSETFLGADVSLLVPMPASVLSSQDFDLVKSYVNSTNMPQANILKSETRRDFAAPVVASFSSRGPNPIIPDILKPDICAPGVDILAAFSPAASPSGDPRDKRSVKYSILSGTSMACPHASGAAAYVKSLHPNWSPSAIRSALMTSASPMNATKNSYGEFSYGAGHIDPVKAANPGLVYEAFKDDYINMLCSMDYDLSKLRIISGDNSSCPEQVKGSPKDLNYPSMAVFVESGKPFTTKFSRTVTNVGGANSTYKAEVIKNSHININVKPNVLFFKSLNEKQSFVVTISGALVEWMASALLVWSDGIHSVRSPIVLYRNQLSP